MLSGLSSSVHDQMRFLKPHRITTDKATLFALCQALLEVLSVLKHPLLCSLTQIPDFMHAKILKSSKCCNKFNSYRAPIEKIYTLGNTVIIKGCATRKKELQTPHLQNSSSKQCLMQTNSTIHRVSIRKLNVCKAVRRREKRMKLSSSISVVVFKGQ